MQSCIVRPAVSADYAAIRVLLHDYAISLGIHVSEHEFRRELDQLPGEYAPPGGVLLVAIVDNVVAGCIGLRNLNGTAGELKRLYVQPDYRGRGIGRQLIMAAIDIARQSNYKCICLDMVPGLEVAEQLYASLGFIDIPPYYDKPQFAVRFMQLNL